MSKAQILTFLRSQHPRTNRPHSFPNHPGIIDISKARVASWNDSDSSGRAHRELEIRFGSSATRSTEALKKARIQHKSGKKNIFTNRALKTNHKTMQNLWVALNLQKLKSLSITWHPGLVNVNIGASNHTTELLLQLLKHLWRCKTSPDTFPRTNTRRANANALPLPGRFEHLLKMPTNSDSEKKKKHTQHR